MRKFIEKRQTTNNRVYRLAAINSQFSCPMCPPNGGCNRNRNPSDSWKDQSKKRKQWMAHLPQN